MIFADSSFWIALLASRDQHQITQSMGIREALAFDGDFSAAGFLEQRA
jgi:predicted nucleic acid-binding protein